VTRTRRNLKPTNLKPAVQISDADRKRKIILRTGPLPRGSSAVWVVPSLKLLPQRSSSVIRVTDKCTMTLKKWREKGESFRVDRHRCIEGLWLSQVMSAKTKVMKTKTALKQETYNLNVSDLKHDLHCQCGFVELGDSTGLGLIVTNTIAPIIRHSSSPVL
jgi:hypothetical protein